MPIFAINNIFPNHIIAQAPAKPQAQSDKTDTEFTRTAPPDNAHRTHDKGATQSINQSSDKYTSSNNEELNQQEQREISELVKRDREVRAHEAAHRSAGGGLTQPASFTYDIGPNGRRYAVGGEVSIDTAEVPNDAHATLLKANRIRSAALAPVKPSHQDHIVAAQAATMANQARAEMAKQLSQGDQDSPSESTAHVQASQSKEQNSTHSNPGDYTNTEKANHIGSVQFYTQIETTTANSRNTPNVINLAI